MEFGGLSVCFVIQLRWEREGLSIGLEVLVAFNPDVQVGGEVVGGCGNGGDDVPIRDKGMVGKLVFNAFLLLDLANGCFVVDIVFVVPVERDACEVGYVEKE